jgi:hypothetical protein
MKRWTAKSAVLVETEQASKAAVTAEVEVHAAEREV